MPATQSRKEEIPPGTPLTPSESHPPSVLNKETQQPHLLDLLDGKSTRPERPPGLPKKENRVQKDMTKGASYPSKNSTPPSASEMKEDPLKKKEPLPKKDTGDQKAAAEEGFFLVEGTGRIICLLIIILLNLNSF